MPVDDDPGARRRGDDRAPPQQPRLSPPGERAGEVVQPPGSHAGAGQAGVMPSEASSAWSAATSGFPVVRSLSP
jgi:hypothetical protein